jgi:hypothetical protein
MSQEKQHTHPSLPSIAERSQPLLNMAQTRQVQVIDDQRTQHVYNVEQSLYPRSPVHVTRVQQASRASVNVKYDSLTGLMLDASTEPTENSTQQATDSSSVQPNIYRAYERGPPSPLRSFDELCATQTQAHNRHHLVNAVCRRILLVDGSNSFRFLH